MRLLIAEDEVQTGDYLRRSATSTLSRQLRIGNLTLDLLKHRVTRPDKKINLSPKKFFLQEQMTSLRGEVLPRSLVASQVWDMIFDSDTNVIDMAIRRLRAKINAYISTLFAAL